MRFILLLCILFSTSVIANSEITTQIHDIDSGINRGEDTLIFLTSGLVLKINVHKKSMLNVVHLGFKNKGWFKFRYNKDRLILSIKKSSDPRSLADFNWKNKSYLSHALEDHENDGLAHSFSPSILRNLDHAREFFYDARTNPKESQCFNRAHVWAYDWRVKHDLYSSKVWLFFTKKFIRKYQFEWWFHVAPMVHVVIDDVVRERIMDMKYTRGPVSLKNWTDTFIRDLSHCPVVENYSDHANFPEDGSCFTMKSSMYYYQPIDLEHLEVFGRRKSRWIEQEVKQAFFDALEITL